jgi:hypothetical protein
VDAAVFQKMIDHAPSERAMRAAALKRQIDLLLFPGSAQKSLQHSLRSRHRYETKPPAARSA